MDHRSLELLEHTVAQGDRVREVLEADAVLEQPRDREDARDRAEGYDQLVVADLELAAERDCSHGPAILLEADSPAEKQVRVGAHLAQGHDDVAWLEGPGARLYEERGIEHEVLGRQDGRPALVEQSGDVATGEPASEDEGPAACLAYLHASCLARSWRSR